jgi:Phosducin
MEGQGVTNYSVDRPSFAFTTSTTEFDEALIRRNVVSKEDAIVAKGASREQARFLLEGCGVNAPSNERPNDSRDSTAPAAAAANGDGEDESDEEEDDDDDVLRRYRERRLDELRTKLVGQGHDTQCFGEVVFISRPEWTRHVNDASAHGWVVVCLTSSDTERTGAVERACQGLAKTHPRTKFVLIPSHSAIPNWPDENLPSLFLYRHGTMQHQLIQLPADLSVQTLERMLKDLSVL